MITYDVCSVCTTLENYGVFRYWIHKPNIPTEVKFPFVLLVFFIMNQTMHALLGTLVFHDYVGRFLKQTNTF